MCLWAPAQAAFEPIRLAPGKEGQIDNFNDGSLDTDTWTVHTIGSPFQSVGEEGGELKLVQTIGFNGAYSTFRNGVDQPGLVEPATADNGNHRVRAVMRRRAPDTDRVAMGLAITTNVFLRTLFDVGDYVGVVWEYVGNPTPASEVPVGEISPKVLYRWEVRNAAPPRGLNTIKAENVGPGQQ